MKGRCNFFCCHDWFRSLFGILVTLLAATSAVSAFSEPERLSFCDQVLSLNKAQRDPSQAEDPHQRLQHLGQMILQFSFEEFRTDPNLASVKSLSGYIAFVETLMVSGGPVIRDIGEAVLVKSRSETLRHLFRQYAVSVERAARRFNTNPSRFQNPDAILEKDFFKMIPVLSSPRVWERMNVDSVQNSLKEVDQQLKFVEASLPLAIILLRILNRRFYENSQGSKRTAAFLGGASLAASVLLSLNLEIDVLALASLFLAGASGFGLYHLFVLDSERAWWRDNLMSEHITFSQVDSLAKALEDNTKILNQLFVD